jgi:OOP family OmpA-OmpF porin
MRLFLLGFVLLFCFVIKAQNLVPNPSFETYTLCPNSNGQIESAIPWTAATTDASSTDYFNSCSSVYGVPSSSGGFQYARTGNAYAGLLFCAGTGAREYLQVQLSNPLIQNKTYNVEFYVNSSNMNANSGSNNIAANISSTRPVSSSTYSLQSLTPHIMNIGNQVINDTLNWVKISGCYTAQGGEEYLTIGNFFDNTNTQVGITGASYYYVDDVSVVEITGTCVNAVNELSTNFKLDVYPNPTSGVLNLKVLDAGKDVEIKVTDVLGREVLMSDYKKQINMSHLEKGIYFVSILQENKTLATKKVIKQ